MTPLRSRGRLGAVIVGLVASLLIASPVAADPGPTTLTIEAPASVVFAERIRLTATLQDEAGAPIVDSVVHLMIDGVELTRRRTDADGHAFFSVSELIPAGDHVFAVTFDGDDVHLAATSSTTIVIAPLVLHVNTLPAIAGVAFEYRGQQLKTGEDGAIDFTLTAPLADDIPTLVSLPSAPGTRIEFGRWWGQAPDLTASFDIYFRVGLHFAHRLGEAVDPATIKHVTVRSSIGEVITLTTIEPIWVHGVRVVSLAGGIEAKDILYGIDEVEIEGANVVNRAQQRFVPRESQDWNVELLFYRTTLRFSDLVFGSPLAPRVRVEYPNGKTFFATADDRGVLALPPLPRGTYRITAEGVGVRVTRPVTMSRDADVPLTVISYVDVALAIAVPATIALVLLLIGRPHLLRGFGRLRARIRRPT